MTRKYYLVRRAIYENKHKSKLRKCRSINEVKRLFKPPIWIILAVVILSLIFSLWIMLFKHNYMLILIPYLIIVLAPLILEILHEDKVYYMEVRDKEIQTKKSEYNEYINNVKEILTKLEINTPAKIEMLKKECDEALNKRNNKFSNLNNRIIDMLIVVPLGALIASYIYADNETHSEGIAMILFIGLLLLFFNQVARLWQYYMDANFKDRYLLDVLNELSYYSDE